MVAYHHDPGYQPLVGAQVRYFIRCRKGWLGAPGFSAAARRVAAREGLIGWSVCARRVHREEVVANSRFGILPWVADAAEDVGGRHPRAGGGEAAMVRPTMAD